jgi:hypothetical protein
MGTTTNVSQFCFVVYYVVLISLSLTPGQQHNKVNESLHDDCGGKSVVVSLVLGKFLILIMNFYVGRKF